MALGFARADAVRRFLIDECGIDGRRIRCSSAGAAEPRTLTADPTAQRENPRADVFMLNEVVSDLAGTAEEQAQRYTEESERGP